MPNILNKSVSKSPIGVFDSGVGGSSIWREIHELLPNESFIYLADSKNAPYGVKTKEEIIELSSKNTELLLKMGCKLIVVACNTATTNAIKYLRETYAISFIGIEPAIKPALLQSKTKAIGILATKGTLASELFHKTSQLYKKEVKIIEQVGTGIVELIETGKLESDEMKKLLTRYLSPVIDAKVDHLVLGCSHYPYLIPNLKKILPKRVKIIDSGLAVAKQTRSVLAKENKLNTEDSKPSIQFYTNGESSVLKNLIGPKYSIKELDF